MTGLAAPWRAILVELDRGPLSAEEYLAEFERLIEEALVPVGIDSIIFDCHWQNFRFVSQPELRALELAPSREFDARSVRQLAVAARRHGLRVGVAMNFLTFQHKGQFLRAFPELAWPGSASMWNPLDSRVDPIAFGMASELVEASEATVFHLGMDEATDITQMDAPAFRGWNPTTLYADAANRYTRRLQEMVPDVLMWADVLVSETYGLPEAAEMIDRSVILCDWHYVLQEEYSSPRALASLGFRVIVCPWRNREAAVRLARATSRIDQPRRLGIAYTTWHTNPVLSLIEPLKGAPSTREIGAEIAQVILATIPMFRDQATESGASLHD